MRREILRIISGSKQTFLQIRTVLVATWPNPMCVSFSEAANHRRFFACYFPLADDFVASSYHLPHVIRVTMWIKLQYSIIFGAVLFLDAVSA
jgi:hypothetical protein